MKLLNQCLLFSVLMATSCMIMSADDAIDNDAESAEPDETSQVDAYKDTLQQEYQNLRKLITAAAQKETMKLDGAFKAIQKIERTHGIPELQRTIAQLRVEACKKQLEDEDIKALINSSVAKVQEIESITKPEQEKVNKLTKKMNEFMNAKKTKDDPEVKAVEKEFKTIQQQMREKSKTQIDAIQENNKKIYQKMADLMKKGSKVMVQLKEKYTEAKDEIEPYDKTISNATKAIKRALHTKEAKLKEIRTHIKDLRTKIYDIEPCFSAQESLDDLDNNSYNWEQLFIS